MSKIGISDLRHFAFHAQNLLRFYHMFYQSNDDYTAEGNLFPIPTTGPIITHSRAQCDHKYPPIVTVLEYPWNFQLHFRLRYRRGPRSRDFASSNKSSVVIHRPGFSAINSRQGGRNKNRHCREALPETRFRTNNAIRPSRFEIQNAFHRQLDSLTNNAHRRTCLCLLCA